MPSSTYASGSSVSVARSREELEQTLRRFGADAFMFASDDREGTYTIAFRMAGRAVRIAVPVPPATSEMFTHTPGGKARSETAAREAHEAEVRRRWRSLILVTKAKLTAVADGISTLEREFLADMVTDDGRTVHERIAPLLASGRDGQLLLPSGL